MNILPVEIARPIKGYSSAEKAIAASKKHPLQEKARSDGALLAGQSFVSGRASFSRWSLEFTAGLWVDITCQHGEVDWRVTHDSPEFESSSEPYALRWPSGDAVVDPEALFAERAGAEFRQLWANETGLWVYLRGKLILWFDAVRRIEDGTYILSVSETD